MNMNDLPSEHASDELMFEYLDRELADERRTEIEVHLNSCQTCRERLTEYSSLFSQIEDLPDEFTERDLRNEVLASLNKHSEQTSILWWLLLIQGILALVLIAITIPSLVNFPLTFSLLGSGREIVASIATNFVFWLQEWISTLGNINQFLAIRIPVFLDMPVQAVLWLLLSATITWIVGNSILLRPRLRITEQ